VVGVATGDCSVSTFGECTIVPGLNDGGEGGVPGLSVGGKVGNDGDGDGKDIVSDFFWEDLCLSIVLLMVM
jgi:hypothetical protein